MKHFFLIFVSVLLFITACNKVSKGYEQSFFSYLKVISPKTEVSENYFIIPNSACHSCIESIYELIKTKPLAQNTTIILIGSNMNDSLQTKAELPDCIIVLDRKGYLYNLKNEKIKTYIPVFLKIKNKRITEQLVFPLDKLEQNLIKLSKILDE